MQWINQDRPFPILQKKRKEEKKRRRIILISVLVILIDFRITLPYIVKNFVNKTLANMKGYTGHVEDVDIHLYHGAYMIRDIEINKNMEDGKRDMLPFFSSPEIDLSVEWRALFKGSIVGELYVEEPVLNHILSYESALSAFYISTLIIKLTRA